jgi:hypothetical protein
MMVGVPRGRPQPVMSGTACIVCGSCSSGCSIPRRRFHGVSAYGAGMASPVQRWRGVYGVRARAPGRVQARSERRHACRGSGEHVVVTGVRRTPGSRPIADGRLPDEARVCPWLVTVCDPDPLECRDDSQPPPSGPVDVAITALADLSLETLWPGATPVPAPPARTCAHAGSVPRDDD